MNRKERMSVWGKIAQTTQAPVQRSSSASSLFPSLTVGWDSSRVPYVNRVVAMLDAAIASGTNNKYNFQKLWNAKFPTGPESEFTSPVKDILVLFRKVFSQLLNNSIPFKQALNAGEVMQRVNTILQAPEIAKLEQVNQSGPLGASGVSLANIRQVLTNMLPTNAVR